MQDVEEAKPDPAQPRPMFRASDFVSPTMAFVIFALGLLAGFPIAIFGFDLLLDNAAPLFSILLGLFAFVVLITVLILAFRRPIWERMFRYGQVEMDRFAQPLAEVARFAAQQKAPEATDAARNLAEMVLARYSWVVTRRWLVATLTGFIAAIAALAGSALLFHQNRLLAVQNERITEQTELLVTQIELGEAQRSTSIVPELLSIGDALGQETSALRRAANADNQGNDGEEAQIVLADYDLSNALRARIVAASIAARPYRYLVSSLTRASEEEITRQALQRRTDLTNIVESLGEQQRRSDEVLGATPEDGRLTDRVVSPERGQLLVMLYNSGVIETEYLTFNGADFSFAEVRLRTLAQMSFQHALMRHADFSGIVLNSVDFGAGYVEGARFRRSELISVRFAGIASDAIKPPMKSDPGVEVWNTHLAGADFTGARLFATTFADSQALAVAFDGALIANTNFRNASIAASTFRHAMIWDCDFSGAYLQSVDFDGAIVFKDSFLDDLAAVAQPGTFVPERFELEPLGAGELASHPHSAYFWRVEGLEQSRAWRVRRVGEFE
ncbi:pentapeptide repeat-containing protein [Mesorhizobium sp. CAU 1741]|uniref:pentapeptide repeat-containing protein n=1 Tax=Mesorhizobium sp. CAU 1741 TaxID=3140366 RepID=UPI00325BD87F